MHTHAFQVPISKYFIISTILVLGCYALPIPLNAAVVCVPSQWRDIVTFFFANYLAHAATVPAQPGTKVMESFLQSILALLLPFAGLGRSVAKIVNHLHQDKDDVQRAILQGAVVVVARSKDWEPPSTHEELVYVDLPKNFDTLTEIQAENTSAIFELNTIQLFNIDNEEDEVDLRHHDIQGRCSLPDGYRMVIPDYELLRAIAIHTLKPTSEIKVSRSQSWLKMAASVVQLIFSSITIYRTQGDQIIRYGYAAFGLSVFPYTLMSLVNFICVGMVGDYSCKYILRTSVLDEAERCGGEFDGTIGVVLRDTGNVEADMEKREGCYTPAWLSTEVKISEESTSATQKMVVVRVGQHSRRFKLFKNDEIPAAEAYVFGISSLTNQATRFESDDTVNFGNLMLVIAPLLVLILPFVFIYALTKFRKESSTLTQRVWMMVWLCANQLSFFPFVCVAFSIPSFQISSKAGIGVLIVFAVLPAIAAIGGFVMVGKMLAEFGTCSLSP